MQRERAVAVLQLLPAAMLRQLGGCDVWQRERKIERTGSPLVVVLFYVFLLMEEIIMGFDKEEN